MNHIELAIPVPQDGKKYSVQICLVQHTEPIPDQIGGVIRHNIDVQPEHVLQEKTADLLASANKRVADLEARIRNLQDRQNIELHGLKKDIGNILSNLHQGAVANAIANLENMRSRLPEDPDDFENPFTDGQGPIQPH